MSEEIRSEFKRLEEFLSEHVYPELGPDWTSDVSSPDEMDEHAVHRAGLLLRTMAHQHHGMTRLIELELRSLDAQQIDALEAAIEKLSNVNCWYAVWDVAPIITEEIRRWRQDKERETSG